MQTLMKSMGHLFDLWRKTQKVIALVILLGLMMISVGITVLILKFR